MFTWTFLCQCESLNKMNRIPGGLVETIGTIPKYQEVSILSAMMSAKMLFRQSSPSQFWHVALLSSVEKFIKKNFCEIISPQSHPNCIPLQCGVLFVTKHRQTSHHAILITCYVTDTGIWFDQIAVWEFVPQFHIVTVTVEVLQVDKRR